MSWSIVDVARMSGVTSRTLRHYDEIGLLPPARTGSNGYRYYEREQLLRLQQIMLMRELGLGLAAIAKVLDGETDLASSLRRHRDWLLSERDRMDQLVRTVDATLADLASTDPTLADPTLADPTSADPTSADSTSAGEGTRDTTPEAATKTGDPRMRAEELFEGFDPAKQSRYEAELVERYGPDVQEHIDESWRRVGTWTKRDADDASKGYTEVEKRLTDLLVAGAAADEPHVLDVVAEHYAIVQRFWTPNAEQYTGLGDMYVDHPDFRARYDAHHPGLAEFLRDAMAAYALERLI